LPYLILEEIKIKTGYKVCDAMTERPITLSSDVSLQKCAEKMKDAHVGAIVIGSGSDVKGILTEQDIVRKTVAQGLNPMGKKVIDIMETELHTVEPEMDIYDALIKMRDLNIRHLPVVTGGRLIGLLTLKDILKIEPQLFDLMVEKFELREETRKPINRVIKEEGICQTCGEYSEKLEPLNDALVCKKCIEANS